MAGSVRDEGGSPDRNNVNGEKKASHELQMVSMHMYVCMYTDVLYMHLYIRRGCHVYRSHALLILLYTVHNKLL